MENKTKLGPRLKAVADLVRRGVTLYDVGTDHAYLPAYLAGKGIVPRAVASDVVEGPLSRARKTIAEAGLSHCVETVLSDGLKAVDLAPPCDVVIAGMGGDLMARILSDKPEVKAEGVYLILQPMTKSEHLRRYLADNGYSIDSELVAEEGKLYEILRCHYSGQPYSLTEEELLAGRRGARREDDRFYRLVEKKMRSYEKAAEGKRCGGEDPERDEAVAAALRKVLNNRPKGEETI